MIVAIDGPSGAGKSTVARAVAKKLGFSCLDTGAMYRAVAWQALHDGVDLNDEEALGKIAQSCSIHFYHEDDDPIAKSVFVGDQDVTQQIRTSEIDRAVSVVSANPLVRKALVQQQRQIGSAGNYVVEGRDIGTVVFPNAHVKIFLTATEDERAHRRVRQNVESGVGSIDFNEVLRDLRRRDACDASRDVSPLKEADDAYVLYSTHLYIEDVINMICQEAVDVSSGQVKFSAE